jgi:hypothetical protein
MIGRDIIVDMRADHLDISAKIRFTWKYLSDQLSYPLLYPCQSSKNLLSYKEKNLTS